jgi:two-component system, LuxR family, response regulator FixJ
MLNSEPTVFVVDDDTAICEAMQCLLESAGLRVQTFDSAEAFLSAVRPEMPGCLVLDIRMPGMGGLELQARLAREEFPLPVVIVTGHGDIPMAVRAMKNGVVDFLEKPVNDGVLLERIRAALERDRNTRQTRAQHADVAQRMARLTPRERQVLAGVVAGKPSKQIASELGIMEKTIEVHRKHIRHKMGVRCSVDLVRAVMNATDSRARPA